MELFNFVLRTNYDLLNYWSSTPCSELLSNSEDSVWKINLLFLCLPPFSEYYVYSQFSEKAWTHLLVSQWTGEVQHVNGKYCKNWSEYQVSLLQSVTVSYLDSYPTWFWKNMFSSWVYIFWKNPYLSNSAVLSMY